MYDIKPPSIAFFCLSACELMNACNRFLSSSLVSILTTAIAAFSESLSFQRKISRLFRGQIRDKERAYRFTFASTDRLYYLKLGYEMDAFFRYIS